MLTAVLLDLDNTLVLFDETAFYLRYMERIVPFFEDLLPGAAFSDRLLRGIRALRKNDGQVSNQDFFMDVFCDGLSDRRQAIWERFLRFYESEYDHIPVTFQKPAGLENVIDQLQRQNLKLVVATNPIFPQVAQEKRLAWAGLDPGRFVLLTHLGNMGYAKPHPEYYRQICAMIEVPPEQCLMVGNDGINDMIAGSVGLKTFQTTEAGVIDYRAVTKGRDVREGLAHAADFSGPLAQVPAVVARLMA
ncbi:MAG: HAD family hydrolase [Desulfobacterales bacterium]|nr:HAD family hydrolase [Desulfobacterales bacterium]